MPPTDAEVRAAATVIRTLLGWNAINERDAYTAAHAALEAAEKVRNSAPSPGGSDAEQR